MSHKYAVSINCICQIILMGKYIYHMVLRGYLHYSRKHSKKLLLIYIDYCLYKFCHLISSYSLTLKPSLCGGELRFNSQCDDQSFLMIVKLSPAEPLVHKANIWWQSN